MIASSYKARAQRKDDCSGALAETAGLLVQGGDARIALTDGVNRYGCPPVPDSTRVAFGSATASVISDQAFAAADRLRRRLADRDGVVARASTYARELDRIRTEFTDLCGADAGQGFEVVFGRSGTDLHRIATELVGATSTAPTLIIMPDGAETGSGVPDALAGRPFNTAAAPVAGGNRTAEIVRVALRLPDATPRPAAAVDAEVEALVRAGAAAGKHIFLVMVDVSKTGLIAPSTACVLSLRRRLSHRIHVLVDACQFRMAPSTLNAYLGHDCMVAVTGSKFVTGPPFSGALLLPKATAQRLQSRLLPHGLSTCSARADWPRTWGAANALDNVANYGLLLRWEAALAELRTFRAVPETRVEEFLGSFAAAVQAYLRDQPAFRPLATPQPRRRGLVWVPSWDQRQTIFPFVPCGSDGAPLSGAQTADLHRQLQTAGWQLAQPVTCGYHGGRAISALRLCISARLVVEAAADNGRRAGVVIDRALATLERVAHFSRRLG